jgi:prepilin-type N-terminal cleavage/methylation domain-containing protein
MRRRLRRHLDAGFTLIELLITILILGIIATAALPLMSGFTERARDAQIEANVAAFETATQRYDVDHKVPIGFCVDTTTDTLFDISGEDGLGLWMQLVNPTDANGNILGASLDPSAGAFAYGSYLAPGSSPASLLLGAFTNPLAAKPAKSGGTVDPGSSGNETLVVGGELYINETDSGTTQEFAWRDGGGKRRFERICPNIFRDKLQGFYSELTDAGANSLLFRGATLVKHERGGDVKYRPIGPNCGRSSVQKDRKLVTERQLESAIDFANRKPDLSDKDLRKEMDQKHKNVHQVIEHHENNCAACEHDINARGSPVHNGDGTPHGYSWFAYFDIRNAPE